MDSHAAGSNRNYEVARIYGSPPVARPPLQLPGEQTDANMFEMHWGAADGLMWLIIYAVCIAISIYIVYAIQAQVVGLIHGSQSDIDPRLPSLFC